MPGLPSSFFGREAKSPSSLAENAQRKDPSQFPGSDTAVRGAGAVAAGFRWSIRQEPERTTGYHLPTLRVGDVGIPNPLVVAGVKGQDLIENV
jgi:hypothetical protein